MNASIKPHLRLFFGCMLMILATVNCCQAQKTKSKLLAEFVRLDLGNSPHSMTKIKELLAQGESPNVADASGSTPLMFASDWENPELIALLLKAKANVNAKDKKGRTALMRAATYGLGENDLHDFASQGDVSKQQPILAVMQRLLDNKADANAKNKTGQTALMLVAFYAQSSSCIRLLVARGANLHTKDKYGNDALSWAVWGGEHNVGDNKNAEAIALLREMLKKTPKPTNTQKHVRRRKNEGSRATFRQGSL